MNRRWSPILALILLFAAFVPAHAQRLVGVTTATQTTTTTSESRAQDVGVNADIGVQVSGTWTGTLSFQATIDKTTWTAVGAREVNGKVVLSTTANGQWVIPASGYQQVRVFSTGLSSGTATIDWFGSPAASASPIYGLTVSTGTLTTTGSALTATVGNASVVGLTLAGATWPATGATIVFEASSDGTNYSSLALVGLTGSVATQAVTGNNGGAASTWYGSVAGYQSVRARVSGLIPATGSLSVLATMVGTRGASPVIVPGLTLSASTTVTTGTSSSIKATPGQLYSVNFYNANTSACYLQIFNVASPTVGTTTPLLSFGIATLQSIQFHPPWPVNFDTAITMAATTARANAAPCTTALDVNMVWK